MAWTQLKAYPTGYNAYGLEWREVPCAAISRSGISFNEPAIKMMHVTETTIINILVDKDARKIAFKIAASDEDRSAGWSLRQRSKRIRSNTSRISCGLSKIFPDAVGCAYRLHKQPGDRIVEMVVAPSNCVGRRSLRPPPKRSVTVSEAVS